MAKQNTEADYSGWTDDWVAKLAADPNKKPDVVVVTGFCGTAPEGKSVRVFLNAELQNWVDVPVEAVLHREAIPKSVSPLGGSYLWIDKSAWSSCQMGHAAHQGGQQQQQQQQPPPPSQPQPPPA